MFTQEFRLVGIKRFVFNNFQFLSFRSHFQLDTWEDFFPLKSAAPHFTQEFRLVGLENFREILFCERKTPIGTDYLTLFEEVFEAVIPNLRPMELCNAKITFSGHQRFGTSCHRIANNYSLVTSFLLVVNCCGRL